MTNGATEVNDGDMPALMDVQFGGVPFADEQHGLGIHTIFYFLRHPLWG